MLDDDQSDFKPCPFLTRDIMIVIFFIAIGLGILKLPWTYDDPDICIFPPGGTNPVNQIDESIAKAEAIDDCDEEPAGVFEINPAAD